MLSKFSLSLCEPSRSRFGDKAGAFRNYSRFLTKTATWWVGLAVISPAGANIVGTLPGDIVVDQTGSATYTIPISVPSGTGGVQPELSLNYSNGGNGLLGVGWSLSGLSQISRGGTQYAADGYVDPADFDDNDQFYLDGQRLIWITAESEPGVLLYNEYRTEIESWSRIRAYGSNPIKPDWFEIKTKAGLTMLYGRTDIAPHSKIDPQYTPGAIIWLISRVQDSTGNYMDFVYDNAPDNGDNSTLLKKIVYTGNANSSPALPPCASIQLEYEGRPDWHVTYDRYGNKYSQKKRLKGLLIVEGVETVASMYSPFVWQYYELLYAEAPLTKRSRIEQIQLFSRDPKTQQMMAVPATTFGYTEMDEPSGNIAQMDFALGAWEDNEEGQHIPLDYNRDGLNDLLRFRRKHADDTILLELWKWDGTTFTQDGSTIKIGIDPADAKTEFGLPGNITNGNDDHTWSRLQVIPGDFNGDGIADLFLAQWLRVRMHIPPVGHTPSSYTVKKFRYRAVYRGTDNGFDIAGGPVWEEWLDEQNDFDKKEEVPINLEFVPADIDGDGMLELYHIYKTPGASEKINIEMWDSSAAYLLDNEEGEIFDATQLIAQSVDLDFSKIWEMRAYPLDIDANGLQDILLEYSVKGSERVYYSYPMMLERRATNMVVFRASHIDVDTDPTAISLATDPADSGNFGDRRWQIPGYLDDSLGGETGLPWWDAGNRVSIMDLNGDGIPEIVHNWGIFDWSFTSSDYLSFTIHRFEGMDEGMPVFNVKWDYINGLQEYVHQVGCDEHCEYGDPYYWCYATYACEDYSIYTRPRRMHANNYMFADVNFDGYPDIVRTIELVANLNNNNTGPVCYESQYPPYGGTYCEEMFYSKTIIRYGNADGFTAEGFELSDEIDNIADLIPFDQDGTGLPQFARVKRSGDQSRVYTYDLYADLPRYDLHPPDMLVTATNGMGAATEVVYASASNRTLAEGLGTEPDFYREVYTPGVGARYPVVDIPPAPMRVVQWIGKDIGAGMYWSQYSYAAGRSHLQGRGFLGFGTVQSWNADTRILQTDYISQAFPNIGMKYQSDTQYILTQGDDPVTDSILLTRTVNTFGGSDGEPNVYPFSGSEPLGSYFPVIKLSLEKKWEYRAQADTDGTNHTANLPSPYVITESKTWWDLLPEPTALRFGNVTKAEVTFKDGAENIIGSTITENSYYDHTGTTWQNSWFLGRLQQSDVTHKRTGTTDISRRSSFEYHSGSGLLTAEIIEPDKAALKLRTDYERNDFGSVWEKTISGNFGAWNGSGFTAKTVIAETVTAWDATKRFATKSKNTFNQESSATYNFLGQVQTQTGPNGKTTEWKYDALGRSIREIRFDGSETRRKYVLDSTPVHFPSSGITVPTGVNQPLALQAAYRVETEVSLTSTPVVLLAPKTTAYIDRQGRELRVVSQSLSDHSANGSTANIVKDTFYDKYSRSIAVSEPYFEGTAVSERNYGFSAVDALGRISVAHAPDGSTQTYGYGGLYQSVKRSKGDEHRITTTLSDPLGKTHMVWNTDRGVEVSSATTGIGNPPSLEYDYDAVGNLVHTIPNSNSSFKVDVSYGDGGYFKVSMMDPDMGSWSYVHDALGRLRRQTNAANELTTMHYNDLGQLIERVDGDWGDSNFAFKAKWYYWAATTNTEQGLVAKGNEGGWVGAIFKEETYEDGNSSTVSSQNATYYDSLGRAFLNLQFVDGKYYYDVTRYDANLRVHAKDYFWRPKGLEYNPKMVEIPYAWHSYGTRIEYNSRGAAIKVKGSDGQDWWQNPKFDQLGRIYQYTNGNGLNTSYTWDEDQHTLETIKTGLGGTATVQNMGFGFDFLGNCSWRIDHNANGSGLREDFKYDKQNQLKERAYSTNVGSAGSYDAVYSYDAYGRLTSKTDVSGAYENEYKYEDTAHVHAVTEAWDKTYEYDILGRLKKRKVSGNDEFLAYWTAFGQPNRFLLVGEHEIEFSYGARHQRITRIDRDIVGANAEDVSKKIYISGWLEQTQVPGSSGWETDFTRLYITGPTGVIGVLNHDATATSAAGIRKEWLHSDHLGSVVAVTDNTGSIVSRFSYDAWGERRNPDNWNLALNSPDLDSTDRGFTGHEMLDTIGLIHMNGRIYDAQLGLFLSADPQIQYPGELQNYHRYGYVHNNPLRYTDPSGYGFFDWMAKVVDLLRKVFTVVMVVVITVATYGVGTAWGGALLGAGMAGLTLYGAYQAYQSGGWNGLYGFGLSNVLTLGFARGIGDAFGKVLATAEGGFLAYVKLCKAASHGLVGGYSSVMNGSSFQSGFLSSFGTQLAGYGIDKIDEANTGISMPRAVAAAMVGGTISEMGGGKFANGAITAAIQRMYNDDSVHPGAAQSEQAAQDETNKLVIGIYGAGGPNAGDNPQLSSLVESMGGTMFKANQESAMVDLVKQNEGANVTIIGYSRGGNAAVNVVNSLGKQGIHVDRLITFDPHHMWSGSFSLKYNNVGAAYNYYQRNERTGGAIGWWGGNPYWGSPVKSSYIKVHEVNYTGSANVNHLNIIRTVLTP